MRVWMPGVQPLSMVWFKVEEQIVGLFEDMKDGQNASEAGIIF